jgi:hypothetical protein
MKTQIADGVFLLFILGVVWIFAGRCAESSSVEVLEQRCNTSAVDDLAGGKDPLRVIEEHAKCLKGDR